MGAAIGVFGALVLAVITYTFDRRREFQNRLQDERIAAAVEFTRSIESYRSAQKRRAHDNLNRAEDGGVVDRANEDRALADAVGEARTAAWAAYHRVLLVADEPHAPQLCDRALREVASIGRHSIESAPTHEELDAQGDRVRATMKEFARHMAGRLNPRAKPGVDQPAGSPEEHRSERP